MLVPAGIESALRSFEGDQTNLWLQKRLGSGFLPNLQILHGVALHPGQVPRYGRVQLLLAPDVQVQPTARHHLGDWQRHLPHLRSQQSIHRVVKAGHHPCQDPHHEGGAISQAVREAKTEQSKETFS